MAKVKVPQHQGPDGQGLPRPVFEKLLELIKSKDLSEQDLKQAIEFCFGASTEEQWNQVYAPELRNIIESL